MAGDNVTVDCINSERCGGQIECSLTEITPSGQTATILGVHPIRQTCDCEFTESEQETLWDRARRASDRQQGD